jgi:hypothetical protein
LATGLDIVVEGAAVQVSDAAAHERFYQQQAILWGEGWPIHLRNGILWDEGAEEPLLLFAVTPTKIFASARGDQWSQTRYRF